MVDEKKVLSAIRNFRVFPHGETSRYLLQYAKLNSDFSNYKSEKVVYIISIVVALCPTIMLFNICMIKDVQFAILVTFLFGILIEIYMSRGIWLKNKLNFLCFAIILVITSMVRHNAILFTLPIEISNSI